MIVVTMTSWIRRIQNVKKVLQSIMTQTKLPDKVYLNLSKTEFNGVRLPKDLEDYINKSKGKIILNWVEGPNTKPFKKIFPILKYLQDDDIILNVDDDRVPDSRFIENRVADFNKYKTAISGCHIGIDGYANGILPELKTYMISGCLYQKKMFNHWDEILNDDIIKTNHDDCFYDFLIWLNGYAPKICTASPTKNFDSPFEKTPALHGSIGCEKATPSTQINIKRFKEVFNDIPCYNYFNTNTLIKKAAVKFILFDRVRKAGDNAEYFYRWLKVNKPEIECKYILNSHSSDWSRLKNEGFNLIDSNNKGLIQKEMDTANYVCFSYFCKNVLSGIKIKSSTNRIFLNHGCFYRVLKYLRDKSNDFDLMIAGNKLEYQTLINDYKFNKDKISLTGQARQDSLVEKYNNYKDRTNNILIQFWWRPWISTKESFKNSSFYKGIKALLEDERLKTLSDKYNVNFLLKLHCETEKYRDCFTSFKNVKLIDNEELFENLFLKSSLIVTDFSSNVYEMGIINKPCIYYMPDWEEFKVKISQRNETNLDIFNKGIGPATRDVNTFFKELETILNNNYVLAEKYINKRNDEIINKNDINSCKRIYEAIVKLAPKAKLKHKEPQQNGSFLHIVSRKTILNTQATFTGLPEEYWKDNF